jgi:hypothetical protein
MRSTLDDQPYTAVPTCLLRPRHNREPNGCLPKQQDELATPHWTALPDRIISIRILPDPK